MGLQKRGETNEYSTLIFQVLVRLLSLRVVHHIKKANKNQYILLVFVSDPMNYYYYFFFGNTTQRELMTMNNNGKNAHIQMSLKICIYAFVLRIECVCVVRSILARTVYSESKDQMYQYDFLSIRNASMFMLFIQCLLDIKIIAMVQVSPFCIGLVT